MTVCCEYQRWLTFQASNSAGRSGCCCQKGRHVREVIVSNEANNVCWETTQSFYTIQLPFHVACSSAIVFWKCRSTCRRVSSTLKSTTTRLHTPTTLKLLKHSHRWMTNGQPPASSICCCARLWQSPLMRYFGWLDGLGVLWVVVRFWVRCRCSVYTCLAFKGTIYVRFTILVYYSLHLFREPQHLASTPFTYFKSW